MALTKEKADELYEKYNKTNESHAFFEALIDGGLKYVSLVWYHGKIEVQTFFNGELIAYEFDPYDSY